MGASIEQNEAGRQQAWHKAVQEKEKGKWWEKEDHFVNVSQEQKRAL